jgi:hypothetical protein
MHRAEQALLGGLLAGGDPVSVAHVRAGDLRDPRHRAIYAALTGAAGGKGGWRPGRLDRHTRRRVRKALSYLDVLAGKCPERGHLASYAAMVTARSGRAVSGHAGADGQLASAASWLTENGARVRRGRRAASALAGGFGAADGDAPPDREVARLARALRPFVKVRVDIARKTLAARQAVVSGPVAGDAGASAGAPKVNRESVQRMVLADLMRHSANGREAVAWMPAEMFTAGPLRMLYELISVRIAAGAPVDPVIIAREARQYGEATSAASRMGARWSLSAIALMIGSTPTACGTARVFGRALLADHVLSERFGVGWVQERELGNWLGVTGTNGNGQSAGRTAGAGQEPDVGTASPGVHGTRAGEPVTCPAGQDSVARRPGGQGWDGRAPGQPAPGSRAMPRV